MREGQPFLSPAWARGQPYVRMTIWLQSPSSLYLWALDTSQNLLGSSPWCFLKEDNLVETSYVQTLKAQDPL